MNLDELAGAIDLGGTKIAAAIVDRSGSIISSLRHPTLASEGREAVLKRMCHILEEAAAQAGISIEQLKGIGIGVPGVVDLGAGTVEGFANLPGWEGFQLRRFFQQRCEIPVMVDNDANAAALGENLFGAGKDCLEMLYITISTGIGGGIISNGRIVRGASGAAGEIGHIVIDPSGRECKCGNYGCWETVSSGTAIAAEIKSMISKGEHTIAAELALDGEIKAEHIFEAYRRGDSLAAQVVERALNYTGLGVANLVNVLNPEIVVLGGGVAQVGDLILDAVRRKVSELAFGSAINVKIQPAILGLEVGVVGAASLVWTED